MALININAHCMDEIAEELAAKGVTVTEIDPPWEYRLEAPRAVLEEVIREHWDFGDSEDLADYLSQIEWE